MSIFSGRLCEAMELRGVTQRWLAERAHTTPATISRYATAAHEPIILDILSEIATALNVSADYLIGLTNISESKGKLTPEEEILISCYAKINKDDRHVLWALLQKYMTANEKDCLGQLMPISENVV